MKTLPAILLIACFATDARAQWAPDGVGVCTAAQTQGRCQLIGDGLGGAYFAWEDYRSGNGDVYLQRLTSTGAVAAGWPVNGMAVCTATDLQTEIALTTDGADGAYVTWSDWRAAPSPVGGEAEIFLIRIAGNGTLSPGWPINGKLIGLRIAGFNQLTPVPVGDGSGGVMVAWCGLEGGVPLIRAHHVTASGEFAPGWGEGPLRLSLRHSSQTNPQILSDGSGGAYVTYMDESAGVYRAYLQRVTGTRTIPPGWPSDGLAIGMIGEPGNGRPSIVTDGVSGAMVTWADISGGDWDTKLQRVLADATIAPGWNPLGLLVSGAPGHQYVPQVAADGFGGAFLSWIDTRSGNNDIYAQHVDGSSAASWTHDGQPLCTLSSAQWYPTVASDGMGGAFFAWHDQRNGLADIYGLGVAADGSLSPNWSANGSPISLSAMNQTRPIAAPVGTGSAIVVWTDERNGNQDVYASPLATNYATPTLLSLVDSEVKADGVRLRWWAGADVTAEVERTILGGDWLPIASISSDASGFLVVIDREVQPGTHYGYRLTGAIHSNEIWVETPMSGFALFGAEPNPAGPHPNLAFSLPSAAPARLELFDPRGRRLSLSEHTLAGRQVHSPELNLRPGTYFVRLTQGARTESRRLTVVRP